MQADNFPHLDMGDDLIPVLERFGGLVKARCVNRCAEVFHIHYKSWGPQGIYLWRRMPGRVSEGLAFELSFQKCSRRSTGLLK